jgi:Uma2 family endonuclease
MSVAHAVSLEEYLHTTYRPDCDWIDGELRERNVGQFDHARLQTILAALLELQSRKWRALVLVEQRLRIGSNRYRVPDLLVVPADYDRSPIVSIAPLLCIEILSPDDTIREIVDRSEDYLGLGTPQVWIFDPAKKRAYVDSTKGLHEADPAGTLQCGAIEISLPELFQQL